MEDKRVLIVGGTGSLAKGLIEELLKQGNIRIRVLARNECQMVALLQNYDDGRIEPLIGDIRDRAALQKACRGCSVIYHLAALKHVTICETMPDEAIETNIIGTQNVISCAVDEQVEKVVYVSTDKAVNANCTYGCTKYLGEKLVLAADKEHKNTKFMVFRCGNLLGSSGSVLPLFVKQIKEKGHVTLTDDRMSRFFITVSEAASILTEIAERGAGGEVFLPVMPSISIRSMAVRLLKLAGLGEDQIHITGARQGEKLSEQMLTEQEQKCLYELNPQLAVICARDTHGWIANRVVKKKEDYPLSSDENILSDSETEAYLLRAGAAREVFA